jgi:hypothetical protein
MNAEDFGHVRYGDIRASDAQITTRRIMTARRWRRTAPSYLHHSHQPRRWRRKTSCYNCELNMTQQNCWQRLRRKLGRQGNGRRPNCWTSRHEPRRSDLTRVPPVPHPLQALPGRGRRQHRLSRVQTSRQLYYIWRLNAEMTPCDVRRSAAANNASVMRTAERTVRPPRRGRHRQRHTIRLNLQH